MNRICELFDIKYPVVQGGMIWCSGWELAAAVSNSGGLGLIGSGSMDSEILLDHIAKCRKATDKPFGVNIPLIFSHAEEFIKIVIEQKVPVVFTSAGSPAKYTSLLKENGITVAHVIASTKFVSKCEDAGVDAIVAEGFEAGGHNGFDETTTLTLIPMIKEHASIPILAAGGIASGRGMLAAMALGAEGVQIGTRFVASEESSAHINFKNKIIELADGGTQLSLKRLIPVRLVKNEFYDQVQSMELAGASRKELFVLLGQGRSRKGMFEGDIKEGELEIGQVSAIVKEILPVSEIMKNIIQEFKYAQSELSNIIFK